MALSRESSLLFMASAFSLLVIFIYPLYSGTNKYGGGSNYISKLGHAFLSGQTHLIEPPSAEVLALENPYSSENRPVSLLWDASLYEGKYYLYFGPGPSLFPWVPVYLLTGIDLSDGLICVIFSIVGSLCLIWLVMAISNQYKAPLFATFLGMAVISFGTWIPLLLNRPAFYEAAIMGAFCYTALGIACLWRAVFLNSNKAFYWKLSSSLGFGLAAACRIFYMLDIVIPFVIWLSLLRERNIKTAIIDGLYLTLPWFACIAGLAAYNYVRFESIFETGIRYQLTYVDYRFSLGEFWQVSHAINHFYAYMFEHMPLGKLLPGSAEFGKVTFEPPYGLFSNHPFAIWSLAFLLPPKHHSGLGRFYGLYCGIALHAIGITFFVMCYFFAVNRYMLDFAPWWMLLAVFGYLHTLQRFPSHKQLLFIVGGAMALWTVYVGLTNSYCIPGGCA